MDIVVHMKSYKSRTDHRLRENISQYSPARSSVAEPANCEIWSVLGSKTNHFNSAEYSSSIRSAIRRHAFASAVRDVEGARQRCRRDPDRGGSGPVLSRISIDCFSKSQRSASLSAKPAARLDTLAYVLDMAI